MNILRKLFNDNSPAIIKCGSCNRKQAKGSELIFISWIKRDGSGTEPVNQHMKHLDDTIFDLSSLSLTNKTLIASEFNSFVVKLKTNP